MSEKKSGCGCCSFTLGCFFGMVLLVVLVGGGGFFVVTQTGFLFDQGLKYGYPYLRPHIEKTLPSDLTSDQKKQILQRIDQDVIGYLTLPAKDRRAVRAKIGEMVKSWSNPQIDKEMQLREIEALIQELKNKQGFFMTQDVTLWV
ncbi:MAG: hypothetical protein HY541_03445 [Deltaproteobacteria bacterium]|nr:hypothetical protein [Deltaproteobacteria bacterium]